MTTLRYLGSLSLKFLRLFKWYHIGLFAVCVALMIALSTLWAPLGYMFDALFTSLICFYFRWVSMKCLSQRCRGKRFVAIEGDAFVPDRCPFCAKTVLSDSRLSVARSVAEDVRQLVAWRDGFTRPPRFYYPPSQRSTRD